MPNRQYYCWKLCLKFNCGCSEYTPTQHVCNANRGVQCHKWMITRSTDKDCDTHRVLGLHENDFSSSSSSSPPSTPQNQQSKQQQEYLLQLFQQQIAAEQEQQILSATATAVQGGEEEKKRENGDGDGYDDDDRMTSGLWEQGPRRRIAS